MYGSIQCAWGHQILKNWIRGLSISLWKPPPNIDRRPFAIKYSVRHFVQKRFLYKYFINDVKKIWAESDTNKYLLWWIILICNILSFLSLMNNTFGIFLGLVDGCQNCKIRCWNFFPAGLKNHKRCTPMLVLDGSHLFWTGCSTGVHRECRFSIFLWGVPPPFGTSSDVECRCDTDQLWNMQKIVRWRWNVGNS